VEYFKYLETSLTNQNPCIKKLSADCNQKMLDIIRCRIIFSSSLMSKIMKVKIQKNIILPFVLYGCETRSPTVSKEHRLSVFGNGMLRKIFRPVMDVVMGEWGIWHNETFYDLYSPNIWEMKSRRMRCVKHVAHMGKSRGAYRISVGRPRHRWWDDIKMHLQEEGWGALRLIWLMIGTGRRILWIQ